MSWTNRFWRSGAGWPLAVFVAGTALAAAAALWLHREIEDEAQQAFDRSVQHVADDIERRLQAPVHGLNGVRSLYASSERVLRAEFRVAVASHQLDTEFPGVRGFGFIQSVPARQREAFVATERADGAPDFTIRQIDPSELDPLYVIQFNEPASNAGPVGLDVGSEPRRRAAIEQAIEAGTATLSANITLTNDRRRSPGALLLVPVYRGGATPLEPAQRRQLLLGVAYAPIVYDELLAGLSEVSSGLVEVELFDQLGQAPSADHLAFDSAAALAQQLGVATAHAPGRFQGSQALLLPGRAHSLRVTSTPRFDALIDTRSPWWLMAGGVLASGLLAALLRQQASGRRRAEALAEHMTADLGRLALVAKRTSNAVIITDRALCITWVNEGFTRLYGYTLDQALGRTPGALLGSPLSPAPALDTLRQAAEAGTGCRVELVNRCSDGRDVWIDTEVQPALDEHGVIIGFIEISSDITASKQAARELAQERQRLARIIDGTQAGTWEHDLRTGEDRINDAYAAMLGYTQAEYLALTQGDRHFIDLVHPDDQAMVVAARNAHLHGLTREYQADYRMRHKNADWVWVQSRGRVSERDALGTPQLMAGIHLDITERKQVEEALRASQAFLDQTGRVGGVGGWELDLRTQALLWSDETCRIHEVEPGYRPTLAEAIQFYAPESRPVIEGVVADAMATSIGWDIELALITAKGRRIWVRAVGEVEFVDGQPVRLFGAFQDITARWTLQDELHRSNEVMSSVQESLPCGLTVFDADMKLVSYNSQFRQMLNLPDALLERPVVMFEDIIRFNAERGEYGDGDIEAIIRAVVERARPPVQPHQFERVRPDGSSLEVRGCPMPGGGWVTTYTDISARRQAEAEVQRSSALLRGAIDAVDEAFVLFDPEDRLLFCNDKYREIYAGMAHLMVPGATFEQIVRPGAEQGDYADAIGRVDEWMAERLAAHLAADTTLVQRLSNGRTLRIIERKMADGHIVGFRIDITELVRATEAAQHASQAKSQFLANMSHEIRTPMNAILGMLALLRKTALTPRQADYAAKTDGAARSLLGLLNDILDFSKVEAGKMTLDPHPFRIDQLLRDLSVILSSNVGRKPVEVLFDIDPALPRHLVGDAMRLQQVLINLGGNAIKFTGDGEVVVSVAVVARSEGQVTLELAVRDTGIGIAPENQARIFSGFTQAEASTTRRFGGTGLGVAISQRLVALMDSELQLDSVLGEGSRFHFRVTLPLAPAVGDEADMPPARISSTPLHALVVDDNATARDVLERMGRSLGWVMDVASSGEQALALLQAQAAAGTTYQAVFVDWQMPGLDGWGTAQAIRALALAGGPPVLVMVTAHGREMLDQRASAEQQLLDGFLVKPITASMLFDAVADARPGLGTGRPRAASPGVASQRLAGLRLLVVEDNANNQQVARELLEDEGASVQIAQHGQEAVEAVAAAEPPFDVVLMDLQMPVMDGFTATRRIRDDLGQRALPIVAMTANAMASDREACLAAGMNDHVGKPFDLDHLVGVLRHQAGRGAAPEPTLPVAAELPAALAAAAATAGVALLPALARLGGKREVYQRMLRTFVTDLAAMPALLQGLAEQGDAGNASRALHTLKGLAATLGVTGLAASAAAGEQQLAASQATADMAQATTPVITRAIAPAVQAIHTAGPALAALLQALQPGAAAAPPASGAPAPLDAAALQTALAELAGLLRNSDMGAMDALARVQARFGAALGAQLQSLDAAIAALDFQPALQHCEQLIENCTS